MNEQLSDDIIKIFKFYDNNKIKHKHFLKNIYRHVIVESSNEYDKNKIRFFDKNNKEIGLFDFDVVGFYHNKLTIWNWSWVIQNLKKNETELTRNILRYGFDIDWHSENEFNKLIKLILVNPRIPINDFSQLELILAISVYISKKGTLYKTRAILDKNNTNDFYDQYLLVYIK